MLTKVVHAKFHVITQENNQPSLFLKGPLHGGHSCHMTVT